MWTARVRAQTTRGSRAGAVSMPPCASVRVQRLEGTPIRASAKNDRTARIADRGGVAGPHHAVGCREGSHADPALFWRS